MNRTSDYKHVLKVHKDILTVYKAINDLYEEYEKEGYQMIKKILISFTYRLADGTVIIVYWEKGVIYEDVVELPDGVNNSISKKDAG